MSSRFQSALLTPSFVYPNSLAWSDENFLAAACNNVVLILSPPKLNKSRGVITLRSTKPFPVGVIDAKGGDLQSVCLLPFELSRNDSPCARSISWSPAGLANNAGCLLAVCTSAGRVKIYCSPSCEISAEWTEVIDISEMLYAHLEDINFGESQIISAEDLDVVPRDEADLLCASDLSISRTGKRSKRKRANPVAAKEPNTTKENERWQIVAVSEAKRKPPKKVAADSNIPLLSAQQYASRSAMLSSLAVAWSPILGTLGNCVSIDPDSSSCCSILAVGGRCGRISFWRIHAPGCYSTFNARYSGKVSLVGLLKAHDSWILAISWALYGSDGSAPQFLLATGSSDGRVKIWHVNGEELLKSSDVSRSFTLLEEVMTADSATFSALSLTVPSQSPSTVLLAIGKGSGSIELCILDMGTRKIHKAGCHDAHDHIVTGLSWAFDGRCLYSCSQDNSMKSWILVGNSLYEAPIPSTTPGLKSSCDVPHVTDSCFGVAVSPGNLAIAVARRFDADLLDSMYEGRARKCAVEFHWIGGQQLGISSIQPERINKAIPGSSEVELNWWESNILWSLSQFENSSRTLNIWDIVAALTAFKQGETKFVDLVLLKWLKSYFGPQSGSSASILCEACTDIPKLSSRRLHLINIISRHVSLKEYTADMSSEQQEVEINNANEEHVKFWTELRLHSENELRERLVGLHFSAILSTLSNSSSDVCEVGGCFLDGLAQMEHWAELNENNVKDQLKSLAAEIRKLKKRKLQEVFQNENEQCSSCSAIVPFESTEYAICSAGKCAKLERSAVTMRICATKRSWFCISCQRKTSKLPPKILFHLPEYPTDFGSFVKSSAYNEFLMPCCPFCGILLGKSLPDFCLSPSPV